MSGKLGFQRHCALEAFESLFGPADVVQDETARSVSLGKVRIERNRLLGFAESLVIAADPKRGEGQRPKRIGVTFIQLHCLSRGFLPLRATECGPHPFA